MTMRLDDRAWIPPHVLVKGLGDEAVLLDLGTEAYFGLNPVATRMWTLLTSSPTIGDALEALGVEYEVDAETLRGDLERFVDELRAKGLIGVGDA